MQLEGYTAGKHLHLFGWYNIIQPNIRRTRIGKIHTYDLYYQHFFYQFFTSFNVKHEW